jgi:uncharacterized repeat protein (TIGR01451 family)
MRTRRLFLGLLVILALSLVPLLNGSAAPTRQLPNPLVVVSNQGQAGPNVDRTQVRDNSADPASGWRDRFFNPAGWQDAYPSMRAAAWTSGTNIDPLLNASADHIWGGTAGTLGGDAGNFTAYPRREGSPGNYAYGYAIPASPGAQYLFLRKDFCLPINAQANAQRRLTSGGGTLTLLNATDSGSIPDGPASVWMNGLNNVGVVPGDESDATTDLPVFEFLLYRGRNALTMRAGDARSDDMAALLYRASLGYAIDPNAIQLNVNPANPFEGEVVNFGATTDGLSDRPPYDYGWTFGDGGTGNGGNVNHVYAISGTYTVDLTIRDSDGPHPLTVSKTATPNPVNAGENLLYRITVQNSDASRALTNVTITDTLPLSTTFVSCGGGDSCGEAGGTAWWSLANLGPGSAVTLDLYVLVDLAAAGNLVNDAYGAQSREVSASGRSVSVQVLLPAFTPTPIPSDTPTPTNTPTDTPVPTDTPDDSPTPTNPPIDTPTPTATATPTPTGTSAPPATATPRPAGPTSPPPSTPVIQPTATLPAPTPAFLPESGQVDGLLSPAFGMLWLLALAAGLLASGRWRKQRE